MEHVVGKLAIMLEVPEKNNLRFNTRLLLYASFLYFISSLRRRQGQGQATVKNSEKNKVPRIQLIQKKYQIKSACLPLSFRDKTIFCSWPVI